MKINWIKIGLPLIVLGVGVGGMFAITQTAAKTEDKQQVETRPTVSVQQIEATNHQVMITTFGEVEPVERTQLSAQVSGEVVNWNPQFVPGGLIKRGEQLFTIEKDAYQAAVLQAEAALSSAEAALTEELARAKVAEKEAARMPHKQVTALYLRKPQVMSAKAMVKSAKAALQLARRDLANCNVIAPFDALVISRNIGVGQFINTGEVVAMLNNIEAAEINVPIAGFDNAFLPEQISGIKADVSIPGSVTTRRAGYINRDLGIVDNATRMSHLVIRIDDPYALNSSVTPIKFGSYAEVRFAGITLPQVYRVPQSLITNRVLWLVNKHNQLESRKVDVLREEGEYFLIHQGLQANDRLVITPPEYPQNGMEVLVATPESAVALVNQSGDDE